MMEDVSLGARVLLAKHKYAGWRDKWRANHPYLEAHPEEAPSWLRKQAAYWPFPRALPLAHPQVPSPSPSPNPFPSPDH